jgi:transcriptional/translational regulatory protein YebC/TACO1
MVAIDAGAEDVSLDDDIFEVVTAPGDFIAVREALEGAGVELESAEMAMRPTSRTKIDEAEAGKLMRLIEVLEEHDDVQAVHANFDVEAEILERVAAG